MKSLYVTTFLFFVGGYSFAQMKIEGYCISSNSLSIPKYAHLFISSTKEEFTSNIKDGDFIFEYKAPIVDKVIYGYIYFSNEKELNKIGEARQNKYKFIIEGGQISLLYNSDKKYLEVKGGDLNEHLKLLNRIDSIKFDDYKKVRKSSDLIAINYRIAMKKLSLIKEYPNSPVITPWFWSVVEFYPKTIDSYNEIKSVFERMPNAYKKSNSGRLVIRGLNKLEKEIEFVNSKVNLFVESFDLRNENYEIVPLHSFNKEKIIIIDFWTTYCAPCIKDKPILDQLEDKYKNSGVLFLRVSADKKFSTWSKYVISKEMTHNSYWVDISKNSSNNLLKSIRRFPTYIVLKSSNMKILKWDIEIDKIEEYINEINHIK